MSLKVTEVSRCLDKKMTIMGFEIPDLLMIFLTVSILNFLFGSSSIKWLLVWLPNLTLALLLRYAKRGKPDNYLIHWIRFQGKPHIIKAFVEPTNWAKPPKLNAKGKRL